MLTVFYLRRWKHQEFGCAVFLSSPSRWLLYGEDVMERLFYIPGSGYFLPVAQSLRDVVNSQGYRGGVVALDSVPYAKASRPA